MTAMIATGMGAFAAPSTLPVATAHIGEERVGVFFDAFSAADDELYTNAIPNSAAADWAVANIPRFECPDATIERTYYFRWWTFRKHLRRTADGWVVTEYLPPVPWAGKENTISCRPKGVFVPFRAQNQTISPTLQCNGQNGKLTQRHRAFETTTFINTHNIKYMFCASV